MTKLELATYWLYKRHNGISLSKSNGFTTSKTLDQQKNLGSKASEGWELAALYYDKEGIDAEARI